MSSAVAYRLLLAVKAKLDPKDIDVGLRLAVDAVAEILRCRARASTFEEIFQVHFLSFAWFRS